MNAVRFRARVMLHLGLLLALVGGLGVSSYSPPPAVASGATNSLNVYLDIPFVQGTYASSGTVVVEDFNAGYPSATGPCPSSFAVGTVTGTCQVEDWGDFGGASVAANVSTQTVGGNGVGRYASTSGTMTISFAADQRYLGMWWSAGSVGNSLKFYKDNTHLLTVTTETIMSFLGEAPGWENNNDWLRLNNDSNNVVTSSNGTTHKRVWYFGNPRGYTSNPPTAISTIRSNEPFVYIHMLAGGNLGFNKVELGTTAGGFEFDNFAVSTTAQTPDPRLVLVSTFVRQHTVSFEPNGSDVTGTMANQVRTTTGPLRTNTFERPGFTFAGWAASADGTGTRYADGANYDLDADVTLYAQWTANSQPSSGGGSPAAAAAVPTLAATGATELWLLGLSALALIAGLSLVVGSRRLRRN